MNIPHRKSHKYKTTRRYRLSFINESTFNQVWSIKLSRNKVILAIIALVLAVACIVSTIIVLTPIRTLLPGYLKVSQRQENAVNSMRIDSLLTVVNINNSYLNNINDILTDKINTDTIIHSTSDSIRIIPIDSIIDASNAEKQFVQQYEEQERFNLSVLAPIAAEGMMFYSPVVGAVINGDEQSTTLSLTVPARSSIASIYNGSVIDSYYTPETGNVIIIQHPNNFISKYSGIAEIFTTKGNKVITGQKIGIANTSAQNQQVNIELWHKGTPLIPLDYIAF